MPKASCLRQIRLWWRSFGKRDRYDQNYEGEWHYKRDKNLIPL